MINLKRVDYKRIKENILRLKKDNELILVLKDNAYGFGVDKVFDVARACNIDRFAVNNIEEAIFLRLKDKDIEILLFGYQTNNIGFIKEYNILPSISTEEEFNLYKGHHIKMALKYDSGMNRFGFKRINEDMLLSPYITTIYTHLAKEDSGNYDIIDYVHGLALKYNKLVHVGGSIAYFYTSLPIRIGAAIYDGADSLYGNVVYVHEGKKGEEVGYEGSYTLEDDGYLAIVDVGYANGIRREFNGEVYSHGKRFRVIGKVCMNQLFVLVDSSIKIGDIVEFYGQNITKEEFLEKNIMSNYESFLLIL